MRKKHSDLVFQHINPPDHKTEVTVDDLAEVLVQRLGLKRKRSAAKHSTLLKELLKFKKEGVPISIEQISKILEVSQSQTYEELRKWRTLGLIEFVRQPSPDGAYIKGYMLSKKTVNRLLDRTESAFKSFMRETRRIAKDFDDVLGIASAREQKERMEKDES
jgi:predicted transcriptional regulator